MSLFKLIRIALLIAIGAEIAVAYVASNAYAMDNSRQVTITVGWSGDGCVTVTEPDPATQRATLLDRHVCGDGEATTYLSRPGQYYGVAIHGPGLGLNCQIQIGSNTEQFESALDYVNCLDRW